MAKRSAEESVSAVAENASMLKCAKVAFDYGSRLTRSFFDQSVEDLAKALLGKLIIRECDGELLIVRIVETEAYPGADDKPSHSFNGKRTGRNAAMYMDPGTAYVYNIYGTMQCLNVSSRGEGAAVLIRAAEPVSGLEMMTLKRSVKITKKALKSRDLCNGPSKLCQALGITKVAFDQSDTTTNTELFFADDSFALDHSDVVAKGRVGIDGYGPEWALLPLRFFIRNNVHVSVK